MALHLDLIISHIEIRWDQGLSTKWNLLIFAFFIVVRAPRGVCGPAKLKMRSSLGTWTQPRNIHPELLIRTSMLDTSGYTNVCSQIPTLALWKLTSLLHTVANLKFMIIYVIFQKWIDMAENCKDSVVAAKLTSLAASSDTSCYVRHYHGDFARVRLHPNTRHETLSLRNKKPFCLQWNAAKR